jgi:hypothetical protein
MMVKEKVKMRFPVLLASIILVGVLLIVSNSNSAAESIVGPVAVAAAPGATRFSSAYTALTKCGSGMTKKEEREAEKNGSDIPSKCRGLGGYVVDISYSACASNFRLVKGEEDIALGMQSVGWKQKTVEWRLANGKPFAVIMRVYQYAGNDLCPTGGKITGESLVVTGLKGYEIHETVDVKSTPNANLKARELADKAYPETKS